MLSNWLNRRTSSCTVIGPPQSEPSLEILFSLKEPVERPLEVEKDMRVIFR
jgi:hypothetical protein